MNKFKSSMAIGFWFVRDYWETETEEVRDWAASEECATLTKLIYKTHKILGIELNDAYKNIMNIVKENGYKLDRVEDHMWDDYAKGFVAGQKFGYPTKENMELVKKANVLWNSDEGMEYGYYQEVCDIITGE